MDNDKQDDAGAPKSKPRKRAPPTIELTAASVSDSAPRSEAAPNEGEAATDSAASAQKSSWRDRLDAARASLRPPSLSQLAGGGALPILMAAAAGAMSALAVLGVTWLLTAKDGSSRIAARMPQSTGASSGKSDMESRLSKVETRVSNVTSGVATPDPALTARLDTLEKSIASLREDIAAAKGQVEKTEAAVGEIKSAPREAPVAPDLTAVEERISKIERATIALTGEIATPPKPAPEDPRMRRVAAATLLDASVRQGEPYSVALAAAKPLAEDGTVLKPLDQFAATGIPSASALSRELLLLLPKLTPKQETAPASTGILDRLSQSAAGLVRIQRTDVAPSAMAAIVARASNAAQRDDVATARRELNALSASERAPVQAWLDKADAREAALAASKQFASDTMTALSKPAQ